jgi:hypothetical protein
MMRAQVVLSGEGSEVVRLGALPKADDMVQKRGHDLMAAENRLHLIFRAFEWSSGVLCPQKATTESEVRAGIHYCQKEQAIQESLQRVGLVAADSFIQVC